VEGDSLLAFHMTTDSAGKQHYEHGLQLSAMQLGQMRMIRIKDVVTFWVAEGEAGAFRQLPLNLHFPAAVEDIQLAANPGFAQHVVDVRIKDLRIRRLTRDEGRVLASKLNINLELGSDDEPSMLGTQRERRWLWLALLCVLLIGILAAFCLRRLRGRGAPANRAAANISAGPPEL
jgi:hypothetical protein